MIKKTEVLEKPGYNLHRGTTRTNASTKWRIQFGDEHAEITQSNDIQPHRVPEGPEPQWVTEA